MWSAIRVLLVCSLLSLCCCGDGCEDPWIVETGTYRSTFLYKFKGAEPKKAFPQKRGKSLELTVYRDTEQFRFRYVRDGFAVEETWNCIGHRIIPAGADSDDGGTSDGNPTDGSASGSGASDTGSPDASTSSDTVGAPG